MKKYLILVLIVALGLIVTGCIPVVPSVEQNNTGNLTKTTLNVVPGFDDAIKAAITAANSGDTIFVEAGTYNEGIIEINKDLTIIGATSKPIIYPTTDTGTDNAISPTGRGWFRIHNGAVVTFNNLVFDGTGKNIYTAVHYHGNSVGGTVENCEFMNIKHSQHQGRGINNYGQHVVVLDCTFTNIQRIGVFTYNPTADTLIKGCTYTGKGDGDWLDYAFEAGNGAAITVEGCTITECTASESGWESAGIYATSHYGDGVQATITDNNIHSNSHGVYIGYDDSEISTNVTLTYNDIHKNDVGVYIRSGGTTVIGNYNNISKNEDYGVEVNSDCTASYDFINNWWGHPSGPGGEGGRKNSADKIIGKGDAVSYLVDWNPWLSQPIIPQQIANKWDLKGSLVAYPGYNWGGLAEGATWEYSIHIKEAISGEFSVGSIHFVTVDNIVDIEVTGIVEQTKSDYNYWSTPNLAAAGRAEYDGVMYNFLFLYNEDNMWFTLSEEDLEPSWSQETVWDGSLRKYQLHSIGLYEPMDPKNIH